MTREPNLFTEYLLCLMILMNKKLQNDTHEQKAAEWQVWIHIKLILA